MRRLRVESAGQGEHNSPRSTSDAGVRSTEALSNDETLTEGHTCSSITKPHIDLRSLWRVCLPSPWFAINASRSNGTPSANPPSASAIEHRRSEAVALKGTSALDYARQHGLVERIKASVETSRYDITWQEQPREGSPGAHHASNPAQNLQAYFRRNSLEIAPASRLSKQPSPDVGSIVMRLRSVGYGEQMRALVSGPQRVSGNRIELMHSALNDRSPLSPSGISTNLKASSRGSQSTNARM